MKETRIKISSVVDNQLPQFVREEFPLVSEFLSQYYTSLESQGNISDILQNIDQYVKVDNLTNLTESTILSSDVTFFDSTINVDSTAGFPDSYGLLLIDSEIITYTSKTSTTFDGCVRGFSGPTSYDVRDELTFLDTESQEHTILDSDGNSTKVLNLSILFLKQFLIKVKKQFVPGFDERELYSDLNENLFIKQSIDFYSSKGTDNSFKILFNALFGQNVDVIKPRDYLIQPSSAKYRITSDFVVEKIEGDPENLLNLTLKQDETDVFSKAQGTITKIEKIVRDSKVYYTLSLDYDYDKDIQPKGSVYGNFKIHPKTVLISSASPESTTLEVDSTASFPNSGNLLINLDNETELSVSYTSKNLNQFLGCSGITQIIPAATEIKTNDFAYSKFKDNTIKVRILGVLSQVNVPNDTRLFSEGDLIKIKTIGADLEDDSANNWFYNIPRKSKVTSISLNDSSDVSYTINTLEEHYLRIGDSITLVSSTQDERVGDVILFKNKKSFTVRFGSQTPLLNTNLSYTLRKNISKPNIKNYSTVNQYIANVQNTYYDDVDRSLIVASPSLPRYLNDDGTSLEVTDRSIIFSGNFVPDDEENLSKGTTLTIGRHGFYTGDAIVYKPSQNNTLGISTGIYFVKKIDDTKIKISRSKTNIFTDNYVSVNGNVTNAKFELAEFTYKDFSSQLLESQKLLRKISIPENDENVYETNFGTTGILINGVEVLNYKSKDNVYYGPIEKIIPISSGSGYDVINPPSLTIEDPIGFGATAHCSVIGKLERIDIIDPGFDYLEEPKISITGGNGFGAVAVPRLITFDHEMTFSSQSSAGLVNLTNNTIGFSSYHKFRDAEEVIYITDGQSNVGGLSTNSQYFISVQNANTVKLHTSFLDAISGTNVVDLTSFGTGNHKFKSKFKKKKIGSIEIQNSGFNYENKLTTVTSSGINTATDVITISNHGYKSGDIITYNPTEIAIGGLTSSFSYFVTKLDDDQFKLSNIGISSLGVTTSFYYNTKQYVNFSSVGSGTHKFNYPEIKVEVRGKIGISTLSGKDFNAVVQPIFRGSIQSVFVESGGEKYGSEEIINFNRQPNFILDSGGLTSTASIELNPIVSNGEIIDVIIKSPGSGYNSPPNLKVKGNGVGAKLTPVISNGSLVDVIIVYGGIGYDSSSTSIEVTSAGTGAKFQSQTRFWKINLVERLIKNSNIFGDDGILFAGLNSKYGIQYTHAYAPRQFRQAVQGTRLKDGEVVYSNDLILDGGVEQESHSHSPIIGWAYDGNPIYGPYGYKSPTGSGGIKALVPGYEPSSEILSGRPNGYPEGFFIEDYQYLGKGDLDEHNGRFCITPEYPNGVYAYFSTIDGGESANDGLFKNYKKPIFPYIIGPTYKSKPIDFNFDVSSNQDDIDINQTKWKRNITPYNISTYEYIFDPNKVRSQISVVNKVSTGSIESIGIVTGGAQYKVGDLIAFKDQTGLGAKAKVSSIKGKNITQISVATSSFDGVKFYPLGKDFVGFTTVPHELLNNDLITITGTYDYKKSGNIKISENVLRLSSGISSVQNTGIVTYFNISGNLDYPFIRENDFYRIGDEDVKILNVEKKSSRIRVLRDQNNISGITSTTYSSGIALTEKTKKFTINFGISTSYNFSLDREFYFDPLESVGLGTSAGVGIVSTLYFSNPGVGITQISIPTQSIYLPNHNFNTGDSLIYSSNGGTTISVSTDGSSNFQLDDKSIVYIAKITNDLIGISTIKVGAGSSGTFVGVGSTASGILYFTSVGTGSIHSFKTNYANDLTAEITKNVVTVSTGETHGLSLFDKVSVKVNTGVSTTFVVKYNDYNRRLLINPRSFNFINTTLSTIQIEDHNYYSGQKVLYTSNTPAGGLVDQNIYYVIVIDSNNIKLSNSYYGATKNDPSFISITSSSSGTISPINPPLNVLENQTVIFDLSDSSLKFTNNSNDRPAFAFKFFTDSNFKNEFSSSESSSKFEVSGVGTVGISTSANVTINLNESVPETLYYKLVPIDLNNNLQIKKDIIVDEEVIEFNKINLKPSTYEGSFGIVGISSTSFSYNILEKPEKSSYDSNIEYTTSSLSAFGSIDRVAIVNGGKGYSKLPGISSVISSTGYDAILNPESSSIGKVESTYLQDIGFDYSSDSSIRPSAKLPDILSLKTLYSFDYIGISSFGRNYSKAPKLVVLDSQTNKIIPNVELNYSLGDSQVTIVKNTFSLNNITPRIIPTNNTNGIGITGISFNASTKDVTVSLASTFSDLEDFPFFVGEKVLIEGTSVGIGSTAKGYNSSKYDYALFTLKSVSPQLGGSNANVVYNLASYLIGDEIPGTFDRDYSSGRIIPESQFPIFNPTLKKNPFYKGEIVSSKNSTGNVEFWDSNNEILKVSSIQNFKVGDSIRGSTSGSEGIISDITSFDVDYEVNSFSISRKGWSSETGFLNNNFQRIHDSDYYQYFSYSLKSQKDFESWDNAVSTLNHPAGFKKFSDLIISSQQENVGIETAQDKGDFSGKVDLSNTVSLNCVWDFDLASENNLIIDSKISSNEVIFNSKIIQDYIQSVGNRVLVIDDISDQFNSNPRATEYSISDSFLLTDYRSKKYVISIEDQTFSNQKQLQLVSLIHDGTNGYLNQYGEYTSVDLGFFDFSISGNSGNLLFYPNKSKINDYYLNSFSFNLNDSISGVGTVNLGSSSIIQTKTVTIPQGTSTSTTIVSVANTYRSSKILVQIGSTQSYYEYDEITIINDGTDVYLLEYGQLTTDTYETESSSGIGTYNAYISGSEIKLDLIPNSTTSTIYDVNSLVISLSDSNSSGVGSTSIGESLIDSSSIGIGSTSLPEANIIATFSNLDYDSSYAIISIEDKTNSQYQVSEFLCINDTNDLGDSNETNIVEFGVLKTGSQLGVITAGISSSNTNIYFTPTSNIETDVKVFKVSLGLNGERGSLSLNNGSIDEFHSEYSGTFNDIKKDFILKHQNEPIFNKTFDGSSSDVVSISDDVIKIPNHFYVTGEEIIYSPPNSSQSIGIATTSISGIGTTDRLPSSLYVVKVDEFKIKVAASASEALRDVPNILDITSLGVGVAHTFIAKNQNKKAIIGIDNIIQSPVVLTSTITTLTNNIGLFDTEIFVSNIDSIYGTDFIKVNDEIMQVNSVGIGSTNSLGVVRSLLGTGLSTHTSSSNVTKIKGNYNIIDNTIYFASPPSGLVPISNPSGRFDEIDYTGITTGSSFSGRVFLRSGIVDTDEEVYSNNYIFDDISEDFDGQTKTFTLKSEGLDITGISTNNAIVLINNVFQGPTASLISGDYDLNENAGITSITFTGSASTKTYDVNLASIPRGGMILSVGSSAGMGYQALVAAGGTAIISGVGTIQSISIGNSGSGYRPGIQTVVNVGVTTSNSGTPNIEYIGTASISNGNVVSVAITNPGTGYTSTNPPLVIFDSPLSYSNIPLVYSSQSSAGFGTGAVIDIVVGQGSSVISYEIRNLGYGYERGEILTVSIGGTVGIPTDTSLSFSEFQVSIEDIQSDEFSAWHIGTLEVIDPVDNLFDSIRTRFPLSINGNRTSIQKKPGSNIDLQACLLIFINDILQVPGESYEFSGGSSFTFVEAPKSGDKSKIIFYKGTSDVDTLSVDILETIKVGDNVSLYDEDINLSQEERLVTNIIASDVLQTDLYSGVGISGDPNLLRPVIWCKQTDDLIINGEYVGKDRVIYEPSIYPTTNIIKNVGIGSTVIYVESVKTFFDSVKENMSNQKQIMIISQDSLVSASATAIVSSSGVIDSISISDGGGGYVTAPSVTISNPIGLGTTQRATASSTVSLGGTVSLITVTSSGSGYTSSNPPQVLIEPPNLTQELNTINSYAGDFGTIVGFGTTTVSSQNKFIFDLYIPENSFLRDTSIVSTATTISTISVGDYIVIRETNVGIASTTITSRSVDGGIIGFGTQFVDNVYQVSSSSTKQVNISGIGLTYVNRIFVNIDDYSGDTFSSTLISFDATTYTFDSSSGSYTVYSGGISTSSYFGTFSWGKISLSNRVNPKSFNFYGNNGVSGISSSAVVKRVFPLKYKNYLP